MDWARLVLAQSQRSLDGQAFETCYQFLWYHIGKQLAHPEQKHLQSGRPASHAGSFFQSAIEDLEFYALIAGHHKIEVSSSSSKMGTGPMGRF
jgi:hypothetical protein